jgi:hypothetical protein
MPAANRANPIPLFTTDPFFLSGCQPGEIPEAATHIGNPCRDCAIKFPTYFGVLVANRKGNERRAFAKCTLEEGFGGGLVCWRSAAHNKLENLRRMLYTIALALIIAWLLGIVSSYTLGGFIYILLVVAIVLILIRFFQGKRV